MDTFTLRWPRWTVRLFGRNPLVRISDRVEAMVLVLAVLMSLLAAPIAAAVGTAVHDTRSHFYAAQAQTRHVVTATVTGGSAPTADQDSPSDMITVPGRWFVGGIEHTGTVTAQPTITAGDPIDIWVDNNGAQVTTPTPVSNAGVQAVLAALAIWLGVTAAAAALVALTRAVLDRTRNTGWQHDIDTLIDHGDGHTATQP